MEAAVKHRDGSFPILLFLISWTAVNYTSCRLKSGISNRQFFFNFVFVCTTKIYIIFNITINLILRFFITIWNRL